MHYAAELRCSTAHRLEDAQEIAAEDANDLFIVIAARDETARNVWEIAVIIEAD